MLQFPLINKPHVTAGLIWQPLTWPNAYKFNRQNYIFLWAFRTLMWCIRSNWLYAKISINWEQIQQGVTSRSNVAATFAPNEIRTTMVIISNNANSNALCVYEIFSKFSIQINSLSNSFNAFCVRVIRTTQLTSFCLMQYSDQCILFYYWSFFVCVSCYFLCFVWLRIM